MFFVDHSYCCQLRGSWISPADTHDLVTFHSCLRVKLLHACDYVAQVICSVLAHASVYTRMVTSAKCGARTTPMNGATYWWPSYSLPTAMYWSGRALYPPGIVTCAAITASFLEFAARCGHGQRYFERCDFCCCNHEQRYSPLGFPFPLPFLFGCPAPRPFFWGPGSLVFLSGASGLVFCGCFAAVFLVCCSGPRGPLGPTFYYCKKGRSGAARPPF